MSDQELISFVQLALRSGATLVRIPTYLLERSSAAAREDVRQLCKLNGVEIEVVAS